MITREIVLDAEAAKYLPFARNQLERLTRLLGNNWSRTIEVMGVTLHLSRQGNTRIIRISGGVSYEFFTSDHIDSATLATPGFNPWTDNALYVAGSFTRNKRPVLSTVFDSPDWFYYPTAEGWGFEEQGLATSGAWGRQRFEPYIHWSNSGKTFTTSHRLIPSGALNTQNAISRHCQPPIGGFELSTGVSIVPTHHGAGGRQMGVPALEVAVRARHAVTRGDWMIVTDSHGRFHTFPRDRYQDIEGVYQYSVPDELVKTTTPPYPAWVTVPSTSSTARVEWLWVFNSDATRAATIALHRDADTGGYVLNPHLYGSFGEAVQPSDVAQFHPNYCVQAYNDKPGLLEFGISIDDAGNLSFELLTEDYFGDSGRYYLDAAYLLDDDRLVTSELECYAPSDYSIAAAEADSPANETFVNIWTDYVVKDRTDLELFRFQQGVEDQVKWVNHSGSVSNNGYGSPASYSGKRLEVFTSPSATYVYFGERWGTDLQTLSWRFATNGRLAGDPFPTDWNHRLVHRGVDAVEPIVGHTMPTMTRPETHVKMTSVLAYAVLSRVGVNARFRQAFGVHPKQHWSFYDAAAVGQFGSLFDIVEQDGKPRKTHRELFNSAFEQNRGYDYYAGLTDVGGFCTAGIWVDRSG